jgi:hypothetical protein
LQDARIKHYPNPSDLEECEYNNRAILKFLRHEHGLTFEYNAMDIVKGMQQLPLRLRLSSAADTSACA